MCFTCAVDTASPRTAATLYSNDSKQTPGDLPKLEVAPMECELGDADQLNQT